MKLLILFFACLLISCSETDCCSPGDDDVFEFSVVNSEQIDLLSPETQGTLNTSEIKIFEYTNEEYIEINNINSDAPKGYTIYEYRNKFLIRPYIRAETVIENNVERKAIIKWNEFEQDTIKLELVQSSNIKRLIKIEYNGNLVWDEETATDFDHRYFQIVK